jgi:DNA repair and recombination protein RAD54B
MSKFKALVPSKRPLSDATQPGANKVPRTSAQDAPPATPSDALYFLCMWRKPQAKKHKTWEGDGVLVLEGGRVRLLDKDTSKP